MDIKRQEWNEILPGELREKYEIFTHTIEQMRTEDLPTAKLLLEAEMRFRERSIPLPTELKRKGDPEVR